MLPCPPPCPPGRPLAQAAPCSICLRPRHPAGCFSLLGLHACLGCKERGSKRVGKLLAAGIPEQRARDAVRAYTLREAEVFKALPPESQQAARQSWYSQFPSEEFSVSPGRLLRVAGGVLGLRTARASLLQCCRAPCICCMR